MREHEPDLVAFDTDGAASETSRVPAHLGDGIFTDDEYVEADPAAARQWDARFWHDRPPR